MPNCHLTGLAARAAHADAFSLGAQFSIQGHHGAVKLRHQALIEVKPNCRMRV